MRTFIHRSKGQVAANAPTGSAGFALMGAVCGLVLAGLAGCAAQQDAPPPAEAPTTPVKSPNDAWAYRYLTLDNGLRVLLASDPEADKAAASLVVFRGSFHEPPDRPGLAHFLEHMLFIGTEKYPEVDDYQAFISANGGRSNAYTAGDHTNYFFNIDPAHFQAAMDRFAQFFIAPRLDPDYVEREKNAVHSEYQLQMKDDGWRAFAANKMALDPAHPAARFNIGSLDTLGEGVNEALRDFFQQHYSANQMALVALSDQGLDEMQAWLAPLFGAIPNRRLDAAPIVAPLFPADGLPATLRIRPEKELRSVSYRFPVPSARSHYRAKPVAYITNLLGHEGQGSLHSALKRKGWIESLAAGSEAVDDASDLIEVVIGLTEAGAEQTEAVTGALFAYIDLLRSAPPEEWRYLEQAQVADLAFRFKEPSTAMSFVYRKGPDLEWTPPQELLRKPYLMVDFDPVLIVDYLSRLHPGNVLVEIVGPEVQTDQLEPWFQVPYALTRGPIAMREADLDLHLPAANPFLPQDLAMLTDDSEPPRKALATESAEVWLDTDLEFATPRANLRLLLSVPGGFQTLDDIAAANLYESLVLEALNEYAYPAQLAGLSYNINNEAEGYAISVGGYSDRQHVLLNAVLDALGNAPIDPEKFARQQAQRVRSWRNHASDRPYSQTLAAVAQTVFSGAWPPSALAAAAERLTPEALAQWRDRRLAQVGLLGLLHGNSDAAAAEAVSAMVDEHLNLAPIAPHRLSAALVEDSLLLPLRIDHADASLVLFVQDDASDVASRAQSALAVQLLRQDFFTELRTERQLGYVVAAIGMDTVGRGGIAFVVQSPVASPARIEQAVLAYLDSQADKVEALPEAAFAGHKASVISNLTERDKNLYDRTNRLWRDLNRGFTNFDRNQQLANQVANLDQAAMTEFVRQLAAKARNQRLAVYNLGKFTKAPSNGQLIKDPSFFKPKPPAEAG